jgi:protein SCO1/2
VQAISRTLFCALAVTLGSLGTVSLAGAQESFRVDVALADQGAKAWKSKSCNGCHTIGKGKRAGPDLAGVISRRSVEWLTEWMKDPPAMAKSDEAAKQMVKEASGVVMPNFRLKETEIAGLIHYMARESGTK